MGLVTKNGPETITPTSCAVAGLVLSWNCFALNVQLHGNCSHVPAWIYVKVLVCYPHSTEGPSDGPGWNCLARALQGFWFEWGCARCFSSGKNYPWDGDKGRSTIRFFSHQTDRLLTSWVDPRSAHAHSMLLLWFSDNLESMGDIFSHFFTSSYGYAFPVTRDPRTSKRWWEQVAEHRHGFKTDLHDLQSPSPFGMAAETFL